MNKEILVAIFIVAFVIAMVALVMKGAFDRDRRIERAQRAHCVAAGGRVVSVQGVKGDGWICDLPRTRTVRP